VSEGDVEGKTDGIFVSTEVGVPEGKLLGLFVTAEVGAPEGKLLGLFVVGFVGFDITLIDVDSEDHEVSLVLSLSFTSLPSNFKE